MSNYQLICTNCGRKGEGKKVTKGSILIELLLLFIVIMVWIFTPRLIRPVTVTISILVALGYSIYRLSSKKVVCETCKHASLIPLNTPVGQNILLMNKSNQKKQNTTTQPVMTKAQTTSNEQVNFLQELFSVRTSKDFIIFQKEHPRWFFVEILILIILLTFFWYTLVPLLAIAAVWLMTKWDRKRKLFVTAIGLGVMIVLTFTMFYVHRSPTIHIDEPQNNVTVQKETVDIKGSVVPKDALVKINDNAIENNNGSFSYSIGLAEGGNTIKVSAETWFKKEVDLRIKRELSQTEKDARLEAAKEAQEKVKKAQEKVMAEQKAWETSKAGQLCKAHPEWSKEECKGLVNNKIWIGMKYDMLVYRMGNPDSKNVSNYGGGSQYQYCWWDWTPSCFYDNNNDGIIEAYN